MPQFGTPHFEDVLVYWKSLCKGSSIPSAEAFDLISIPSALPDMTLWDFVTPDKIICRFAGTHITAQANTDVTGVNLLDIMPAHTEPMVMDDCHLMFTQPCGMHYILQNKHVGGKVGRLQSITLPLEKDAYSHRRFITVNNTIETVGFEEEKANDELLIGYKFETREPLDLGWGYPATLMPLKD